MLNYRTHNIRKNVKIAPTILVILFVVFMTPLSGMEKSNNNEEINRLNLSQRQSEEAESITRLKKFQVELYGGIMFLKPSDLNLFLSHDRRMQEFSFDSYFDHLVATEQIESWTQNQEGEWKEIRRSYPIGGRLKYYLSETIAFSVGFKYMSSKHTSELEFQYSRNELSDEQYNESIRYSPYSLSAKAYIPTLGFHIAKKMKNVLVLEGFITGGPIFAECQYLSEWSYEWVTEGPDYRYVTYNNSGTLEEEGSGTGIALELGGRFSYPIIKSFDIFLEASYAYQGVKSISGTGREERDGRTETWDGTWAIKSETVTTAWGQFGTEFPTNYWPNDSEEDKVRDFELDLSGFQLKLGLSFRF